MKSKRLAQVEELIRSVIADEMTRDWDFGSAIVSVTHVVVSPDLSHARVLVSILAGEQEEQRVWKRVQSGTRRLQRRVAREVRLRRTPVLSMEWDRSIEKGTRVLQIMKELREEEGWDPAEKEEDYAGENGRQDPSEHPEIDL